MIKIFVITAALVGFLLLTPWGKDLTSHALASVNPVFKQNQAFSKLKSDLSKISSLVGNGNSSISAADAKEISSLLAAVNQSATDAQNAAKTADLPATLSNVLSKIGPATKNSCIAQ